MNPPIPHTFDPAHARELCALSAQAYQTSADSGGHVLMDRREGDLLVAFRGTADLRDWLTDLDCEFIRVRNYRVHRGFHEAMMALAPKLDSCLAAAGRTRVWVTGHSLGGALAALWAMRAAGCGHDVAGVYTFGQPRVGNAAFAECYDSVLKSRTFRVVHADDIVPRVPWQLGRYRHAGHEMFYPTIPGHPMMDAGWRKLPFDLLGLGRFWLTHRDVLVADHHVKHYLALFPAARRQPQPSHL